jgi:adenylylsulfate reductase subunit B
VIILPPIINPKLCDGCGKCVEICPTNVFFGSKKGEIPVVTYPDECWHENACVEDCPIEGAIKLRTPLTMMICYQEEPKYQI